MILVICARACRCVAGMPRVVWTNNQLPRLHVLFLTAPQHLPLNVDIGAFATTAKGEQRQVRLPDDYPVGGLSKADVHGDLGVIVIALNWPR